MLYSPGAPALALQAQNNLNKIILDDASQAQNPDPIVFGRGGQPLSASNTLRGGDTATNIVGVMTYTWAGNAASGNAYRVRPIGALTGNVNFVEANSRPASAPAVGGNVKVVGMNLLNFFNTFADNNAGTPGCFPSGTDADCRGANSATEFARQYQKTVAAILAMNPDVLGVNELENDGYGPASALQFLVDQLNAATAPGTYAFIDVDANTGQTNAMGTDAIRVALLYKPGVVTPIGQTSPLNTVAFVNGGDGAPRNRPSLAQAFQLNSNSAVFIVDVNHLKSKGSACDSPDAGDGQGNCNHVRVNAAIELMNWFATDPTGTGDPDILMLGDYNSYAMEDPITVIKNAGFTNLIESFLGPDAYSYVFDGQWGYLDHALGSTSLVSQVTGVGDYHINSDEPSVLDYNVEFKSAGQVASLYAPDQFRISDHDPVVVGLNLENMPPNVNAGGPYLGDEGASVGISGSATDPEGQAITYAWTYSSGAPCAFGDDSAAVTVVTCTDDGTFTLTLTAIDAFGASASADTTLIVANVAPTIVSVTNNGPIDEGSSAMITVVATDPAGPSDPLSYEFDCNGDLTYEIGPQAAGSAACVFPDNGTFTVNVRVSDGDGGETTGATTVTVNNVDPEVMLTAPAPGSLYQVNKAVNVAATFTDPGTADTHTCQIDWGNGTTTAGMVAAGTCSGSYAYPAAGIYAIVVTVADDDGGSNSASTSVVVFDPNGGFVTGGGWINSPAGAYRPNPTATGKANFGFVAKYKKGDSIPEGNVNFRLNAAGFGFNSTSYQWLVVPPAGVMAQIKGYGRINGAGTYGFMIWAGDGILTLSVSKSGTATTRTT